MLNNSAPVTPPGLAAWRFVREDQLTFQQRRRCLTDLASPWVTSSQGAVTPAGSGRMHVAFFDATKDHPNLYLIQRAAAQLDPSQVKLYAVTRVVNTSYLPNFHFIKLGWLLDHKLHGPDNHWTNDKKKTFKKVQCIFNALTRVISSAQGKQYVAKALLPWLFPLHVRRLLVLDSDVIIARDLRPLWAEIDSFGRRAVMGLVNEQSDYFVSRNGYDGFNGGVQLLNMEASPFQHATCHRLHATQSRTTPCQTTPRFPMPRHTTSLHTTTQHTPPHHAMSCHPSNPDPLTPPHPTPTLPSPPLPNPNPTLPHPMYPHPRPVHCLTLAPPNLAPPNLAPPNPAPPFRPTALPLQFIHFHPIPSHCRT